jgi:Arc/MetJ family transcription regulator
MATEKVSLTLEEELVSEARQVVGGRGLSAYVNRALRHQLQRDRLVEMLAELEREHGPIDPAHIEEARRAWPAPSEHVAKRRSA